MFTYTIPHLGLFNTVQNWSCACTENLNHLTATISLQLCAKDIQTFRMYTISILFTSRDFEWVVRGNFVKINRLWKTFLHLIRPWNVLLNYFFSSTSSLVKGFWSAPLLTNLWHIVLSKFGIFFIRRSQSLFTNQSHKERCRTGAVLHGSLHRH